MRWLRWCGRVGLETGNRQNAREERKGLAKIAKGIVAGRQGLRRPLLIPLVPLYWLGLLAKNAYYDLGWLRAKRLARPVVSVGSLSAGGAGKTPVVLMLAELLQRHGFDVDVLSRGYGRGSGVVEEVDPAGQPIRFGDEPLEMARRGVRVVVGADRVAAGRFAEGKESLNAESAEVAQSSLSKAVHLLDDGFQHRRLTRDLDIVLLTLEDARDWLLPAGNLREPLRSLARADVVVVREDEAAELARHTNGMEVWVVRRELVVPAERPKRPVVFCGIARPQGFLAMLGAAGVEAAGRMIFPDHHAYTDEDFRLLEDAAVHAGADGFCTTAKDAVKIPDAARQRLERIGPVWVAELRVSLLDEQQAIATLRRKLKLA